MLQVLLQVFQMFKCMFQVFHLDVAYVSMHVYFKRMFFYLRCFRLMLQVFHLNVAKVDLDIAYVAMATHTCFKRMFKCCVCCSVSFGCFKNSSRGSTCCNGAGGRWAAASRSCLLVPLQLGVPCGSPCHHGSSRRLLVLLLCACRRVKWSKLGWSPWHAWVWASEPLVARLFRAGTHDKAGAGVAFAYVTEEARELNLDALSVRRSGL
jgi:hypothetical protein